MTAPADTGLERRRERSAAAQATAEKARAGVTELDHRLQTNASLTQQQKQALRNAEAEAARLKRALKNAAKEKDRLTKQRKQALSRVQKAEAKAKTAEAKYDKSVLAEMVRREKERDRAASADGGKQLEAAPSRVQVPAAALPAAQETAKAPANGRRRRTAAADPPPEKPDAGTATAVRTAARKTAASAARKTAASASSGTARTSRTRAR